MQYTNLRTDVVVEAESGESSSSQACTSGDFAAAVEVFWAPVPNLKADAGAARRKRCSDRPLLSSSPWTPDTPSTAPHPTHPALAKSSAIRPTWADVL